ncbi:MULTISPECIES: hypothetical protein [Flavobacterium]|uniref:hypothetical protein n=1 Tax=Flavobacterium TaxID=237 RepID=UPI001FCBB405|nr:MULTISPECIES: hypothetical protein [Flavobacterium]UOK41609.1 hypothetical protein LZF87_09830 [Flavobacterium enshiense]
MVWEQKSPTSESRRDVSSNAVTNFIYNYMSENKIDNFNVKGKELFQILIDKYDYTLEEIKVSEINSQKWATQHIYVNNSKNLKIVIKQEPYYTDYGFSFFIYKIGSDKYNIPHEKQDKEDTFLKLAYEKLFSTKETVDLISGENWKELKRIPLQF